MVKICVVIIETELTNRGDVIPCIVKEGETGYFLTNWTWGKDIETAQRLADEYNERLGISREEAITLTLQSMKKR